MIKAQDNDDIRLGECMTLKEKIFEYIRDHPGATDTELEKYLNVRHQAVNQECRSMERAGMLSRVKNPDKNGLIGNYPTGAVIPEKKEYEHQMSEADSLQEEDIKHILTKKLTTDGWDVRTAWGHTPGVDIDARRNGERWLIEIKGPGSRQPMRVNYFLSILGETLQRMDDPNARYTIALPDIAQYRGLWQRLPALAKKRTTIDIMFVQPDGSIEELK